VIDFLNYAVLGILTGQLYAIVAMGFVVIYRASRVFNFAQGELIVLGGFIVWTFVMVLKLHPVVGALLSVLAGAVVGMLIERVFFRRLVGRSVFAMVMVTIGMIILLRGVMLMLWGAHERQFPAIFPLEPVILGELFIPSPLLASGVLSVVAALALHHFFNRTRTGLALAAVSEDHEVAQSMGISVRKSMAMAWALGVSLSIIGAMTYLSGKTLTYNAAEIGFAALPIALLAGLESIRGLLLGGAIIGLIQGLTSAYIDPIFGGQASSIVPYLFMLGVLLIRPTGMFGWKIIERV
jgi:branched-chain amino acid transport system permease protein